MTSSNEGDPAGDLFHAFFDSAPIGAAVIASDGSWCRVNAALASMLGYSVDELMTKPFFDLTHPADLRATAEKRLRARDGNYVWVHTTAMHERDTDGGGDHFMTYVLDIAARKDADAELRRSELQYRRLFESAKDGILILDAETGRVVDANPFMTELTGYRRDDLLGKLLWEIGPFADEAASKFSFAALKDRGYVRYDDLPLKTIDGRKVEVEFVSNVYLVNDEKVIQCNVRDITARKKAEAALRMRDRAIEAVSQGILITDTGASDNPIVYASPGFTALTGYTN
ncbi:MAG TPA: PAS domain S-box protein, partial [Myxococcota bacterium]|nr:PAS domain S-box protein [Myxococcota bacterium]